LRRRNGAEVPVREKRRKKEKKKENKEREREREREREGGGGDVTRKFRGMALITRGL